MSKQTYTENIDPKEIEHFSTQAETWWDPEGPMKMLHSINPIRLAFILDQCDIAHKTILDIGCGGGILTEGLASHGAEAMGIDMAQASIETAKQHAKESNLNINYLCTTAEQLAQNTQNHFEVITCLELLEHVPDPKSILQACQQLIKPGGLLFLSTLNRTFKSYLHAIVGAEYILNFIPKGTHQYDKFIKPHELTYWAKQCGFKLKALKGLNYHPITKSFNLSQNVSVNYLACFMLED